MEMGSDPAVILLPAFCPDHPAGDRSVLLIGQDCPELRTKSGQVSIFSANSFGMGEIRGDGRVIGRPDPVTAAPIETLKEVLMLHILKNRRDQARSTDDG